VLLYLQRGRNATLLRPKILTDEEIGSLRREIAVRDGYRCILCGKPAVDIAHIVPRSHAVKNSAAIWRKENMACSCRSCHRETKAQRQKFLERMIELYGYDYSMTPWAEYLIKERTE